MTACSGKTDPASTDDALSGSAAIKGDGTDPGGKPPANGGGKGDPGCGATGPGACVSIAAGAVCTDPNGKDLAWKLCQGKGLELTGLDLDPKGGCTVTCCGPSAPPPPVACTWTAIGDGTTCLSYVDLKTKAVAICAAQKADPRSLYPADDCAGGATIAKLECCETAPANEPPKPGDPPPPPKK
jgi:hypothetical protein